MSVKNDAVITRAWLEGSNAFQQRIPNPATAGYARCVEALFDPMNNDMYNEFSGMLVGMMGTYVESKLFENPLRVLKKPAGRWGNTERHVAVNYLHAHAYKVDDETLLKLEEKPEYVEWFYSVQEPRRYEFSWGRYEMARVFAEPDGYGFDELLTATLTQMYSSDNLDEMNIMIQMFAEAENRMGLFKHQISAAPTDKATAQELMAVARMYAGRMKFPTQLFNHIPVPVHETPETLVFWCTPEVRSVMDVYALAELFNIDRAEIPYRIIEIPEFPIPNVYAALTSEDFIYARDVYYGVEPPFRNPATLTDKYYLHHAQMIGVNPAANCVLFTTDSGTTIPTVTVTPSGLSFTPNTGTIAPGGTLKTKLVLAGTVADDDTGMIAVEPDAGLYSVVATREEDGDTVAVELNSRTYVDDSGVLHAQKSGLEAGDVLTVTATSVYINPSGATTTYTATFTATVV